MVETKHPFSQAFSQTLKTGRPESMYFFHKWASIGQLYTLLAKTLLSALAVSYNENLSG